MIANGGITLGGNGQSLENAAKMIHAYLENAAGAKHTVALYFFEHLEDIAFLTLDEISHMIDVSPSTITRTATEIGFRRFPDLQSLVREGIRAKLIDPADRLKKAPVTNVPESYAASLECEKANLARVMDLNPVEKFERATEVLVNARSVYLYGVQASHGPILMFGCYLAQIRRYVHRIDLMNMDMAAHFLDISPQDAMLVVSLPRYHATTLATANEALLRGCPLISVTDSIYSPLALKSTVAFAVPYRSVGFFHSQVATCALLNALFAGINLTIKDPALQRLEEQSDLLDRWGLVDSPAKNER